MKSLVFLVSLLFLFERSVQEQRPVSHDDVQEHFCNACTELKELKDMMIEQRVRMQILQEELSSTKNELQLQKSEQQTLKNELQLQKSEQQTLKNEVQQLQSEQQTLKNEVQQLKSEQQTLKNEVQQLQSEQQTLKNEVQQLQSEQQTLKNELQNVTSELETVRRENSALSSQLTAFESRMVQVEKMLEDYANRPKVAFSVGLTDSGHVGPFDDETNLVYEKIFSNLGQAYNTTTGIFTAPTKGAYYFRFTGFHYHPDTSTGLKIFHNKKRLHHSYATTNGNHIYFSNGFVVELEEGDEVYMMIPGNYQLYDHIYNRCTFTGFLLFPL